MTHSPTSTDSIRPGPSASIMARIMDGNEAAASVAYRASDVIAIGKMPSRVHGLLLSAHSRG